MTAPRATYRLQLRKGFGFNEAAERAPYLARLGISHVYLSPFFKARPDSPHGYDITDHAELNPDLGTEADYQAMIEAFRNEGLGRILDFVPNHMGVGGADNPLWLDVLEWGQDSRYASWFDIDWRASGDKRGKVLSPILGEQYGQELRSGKLTLVLEDGAFSVWAYGTHKLPVSPLTYPMILGQDIPSLDRAADLFIDLPQWGVQVGERAAELKRQLAVLWRDDLVARQALEERIASFNHDWRELDRLIAAQNWRVAFFRVAGDEINYRRFFNINDLAGLRIELEPVFDHAHRRVFQMLKDGEIDGLRIDHIDGLFDPKAYLKALRRGAGNAFYLVVEKILAPHERLRDWPIEGDTGYAYLNLSLGVLVESSAESAFDEIWRQFGGSVERFEEIARRSKLRILSLEMKSELVALGRVAARLANSSPMTADLTRGLLQRAIKQTIANFPVYRTYVDFDGWLSDADRRDIAWAISRARRFDPDLHPSAFDFLENVLTADAEALNAKGLSRTAALRFAMKLQQLSGPVMAKGVEDTAFYRYNRFIALNEVGGAPERFGITPTLFHRVNASRAETFPLAMLASATHDTKRGEDARARLAVLSEIPEEWRKQVASWSRILRARSGDIEAKAPPTRDDEYLLYQMLVGAWPVEMLASPDIDALAAFGQRMEGAVRKALREAKQRSNWDAPNAEYEEATLALMHSALRPGSESFLGSFLPFVAEVARYGVDNSLVQTVLKLTVPGVPDTFQGCELWDFSLVDPDNRHTVDYPAREAALAELTPSLAALEGRATLFGRLIESWQDGRVKLATVALLLDLRRKYPRIFSEGDYRPIEIDGDDAAFALGFQRGAGEESLVVIVGLRPAMRAAKPDWNAKARLPAGIWIDVFQGCEIDPQRPVREWLAPLPFSIMVRPDARGNGRSDT